MTELHRPAGLAAAQAGQAPPLGRARPPGLPASTRGTTTLRPPAARSANPLVVGQWVHHPDRGKGRVIAISGPVASVRFGAEPTDCSIPLPQLVSHKAHRRATASPVAARPATVTRGSTATTVSGATAPGPRVNEHAWHPVTRTLVILAREQGLRVDERPDGWSIRTQQPPHRELVRVREDDFGSHTARAAVTVPAGASDALRSAAAGLDRDIARHLEGCLSLEGRLALMGVLRKAQGRLDRVASRAPAKRTRVASKGSTKVKRARPVTYIRVVQGGAPGLGRRS
jgi:hypothetical protein